MAEYLIMFNDEWVREHTEAELNEKAAASHIVMADMQSAGVLVYAHGALDASTAVASVEAVDGRPVFRAGVYVERDQYLGGFTVIEVPDDDAARYWAGRLAIALDWPQELHRFGSRRDDDTTRDITGTE